MSQFRYKARSTKGQMDKLVGNLVFIMIVFFAIVGIVEFTKREEEL